MYKLHVEYEGSGILRTSADYEFIDKIERDQQYDFYVEYFNHQYLKGRIDYYIISKKG